MNLFGRGGNNPSSLGQHYPKDDEGRIQFWRGQIAQGQAWIEPYMKAGNRIIKLYNNIPHGLRQQELEHSGPDDIERMKGSMVFAWVDGTKANLVERSPEFSVTPESMASVGGEDIVRRQTNYWYDVTGQYEQDDQIVLDALLTPYGLKKIGWNAVVEQQKELYLTDASSIVIEDPQEENLAMLALNITRPTVWQDHEKHIDSHILLLETPNLDPEVMEIVEGNIEHHKALMSMEQPETDTRVQWEAPFAQRWQPDDFVMDPFSQLSMKDAKWQAWRIRAPLYWWKRQPTFDNTEFIEPSTQLALNDGPKMARMQTDTFGDYAMVEGWEIWARDFPVGPNKNRNMLITIADNCDKMIKHEEEWPYKFINDYPGVMLKFQDNVKTYINKPTLALAGADNIHLLVSEFFDSMLYTMRKSKNLHLYDSDLLSPDEMDKVMNAPDGTYYGVPGMKDIDGDPIRTVPFLQIENDRTQYLNSIMNFFDRAAGTPQPQQNIAAETATEANIIERRNTSREDSRVRRFETMQIETMEKMWQLHQQFLPEREVLIDPRTKKFGTVSEEVARGQYRFAIDVSSRSQSKAVERKNAMDLYNLIVASVPMFMQLKMPPPNIVAVLEKLLRTFDIKNVEQILPGSPSEFQDIMQSIGNNPEKAMEVMSAIENLSAGGSQGAMGGAGSINSQLLSQSPATPGRQEQEASSREGAGGGA